MNLSLKLESLLHNTKLFCQFKLNSSLAFLLITIINNYICLFEVLSETVEGCSKRNQSKFSSDNLFFWSSWLSMRTIIFLNLHANLKDIDDYNHHLFIKKFNQNSRHQDLAASNPLECVVSRMLPSAVQNGQLYWKELKPCSKKHFAVSYHSPQLCYLLLENHLIFATSNAVYVRCECCTRTLVVSSQELKCDLYHLKRNIT